MKEEIREPMRLGEISLAGFRNYRSLQLQDITDLTILVGRNGVGKTNILEGIALMTSAQSFRNAQISQLIEEGGDKAYIKAELSDGNRRLTTELSLEPGKKRYSVNGKAKAITEVRGVLPAVSFTPDDLELAKRSSRVKRDGFDNLGVQLAANYSIVRRDYEKVIRYKNRLLKDEASDSLIESINETLITCGSQLFCYRTSLIARLLPLIEQNYSRIAGKGSFERFRGRLVPSWERIDEGAEMDLEKEQLCRDEVRENLAESLARFKGEERRRRRSLVGPHNDGIDFLLDDRDAADFASQGQQRSIVLAWKLAEVELVRQSLGISPVLLLDDVMSELDGSRRDMLVRFVTDDMQTFITATDLSGFNNDLLDRARVLELPLGES